MQSQTDRASARLLPIAAGAILTIAMLSGGCAWHEPDRVERDFGESVRQMVQEQIHDKQAAARPAASGPDLLDGVTADTMLRTYRDATAEARVFRQQQPGNPVPVTAKGAKSDTDAN